MIVVFAMPQWAKAEPVRDRVGITRVQPDTPQTSLSRAKQEQKDAENQAFKKWASIAFIALGSSTLILFVLGCGNRVVVFADASDAFRSACIFIAPVVTAVVTLGVAWVFGGDQNRTYPSFVALMKDNPAALFVVGVGALWWLWAILGTIISSIQYNGLIVGTVVAILKLGAVFSLLFIWWGIVTNYNNDSIEQVSSKLLLLSILAWFGSKFLNGERVANRRLMLQDQAQAMVGA